MSAAVTARRGVGSAGLGIVRAGLVGLAGAVLMWLSVAVTLAMTLPEVQPGLVLALWPSAATARSAAAFKLMLNDPGAPVHREREALALAGGALAREPVLAEAASALGAAANLGGDEPRAVVAYRYAERLSRRDLTSQLWFIERAVGQGDVAGALAHYDIALRSHPPLIGNTLLPVLARASAGAPVRGPLITLLRRRPNWRARYMEAMLAASLPPLALAEQLALLDPTEAPILSNGLYQLVQAKQYRLAAAVLPASSRVRLHNGGFEQEPSLLPFDWWLAADDDLAAYREPGTAGQGAYVLRIASKERGGPVARQLVTLPAGRYALGGIVQAIEPTGSSPSMEISCADRQGGALATQTPTASTGGAQRFALVFAIPDQGCQAQWITISTAAGTTVSAWVDGLTLSRLTGSPARRPYLPARP